MFAPVSAIRPAIAASPGGGQRAPDHRHLAAALAPRLVVADTLLHRDVDVEDGRRAPSVRPSGPCGRAVRTAAHRAPAGPGGRPARRRSPRARGWRASTARRRSAPAGRCRSTSTSRSAARRPLLVLTLSSHGSTNATHIGRSAAVRPVQISGMNGGRRPRREHGGPRRRGRGGRGGGRRPRRR